jgi:hypothetical protein
MSEPSLLLRDMFASEETALWARFHGTIHSVNAKHDSPEQLAAWSPRDRDMAQWTKRMQSVRANGVLLSNFHLLRNLR